MGQGANKPRTAGWSQNSLPTFFPFTFEHSSQNLGRWGEGNRNSTKNATHPRVLKGQGVFNTSVASNKLLWAALSLKMGEHCGPLNRIFRSFFLKVCPTQTQKGCDGKLQHAVFLGPCWYNSTSILCSVFIIFFPLTDLKEQQKATQSNQGSLGITNRKLNLTNRPSLAALLPSLRLYLLKSYFLSTAD